MLEKGITIYIDFDIENNHYTKILPVNPESITITSSGANESVDVVNFGEVSRIKNRKLITFDIESFFPQEDYYPYVKLKGDTFYNPSEWIYVFNYLQENKKTCHITITNSRFPDFTFLSIEVSIEKFIHGITFGTDDVSYKISFKEMNYNYKPTIRTVAVDRLIDIGASGYEVDEYGNYNIVEQVQLVETTSRRKITKFIPNAIVRAQGIAYSSEMGDSPTYTVAFSNAIQQKDGNNVRIRYISTNKDAKYPYQIWQLNDSEEGKIGWMSEDSLILTGNYYNELTGRVVKYYGDTTIINETGAISQ